jgi:two-component system, OmpR family, response regulator PrrA
MKPTALVVDDDPAIRAALAYGLGAHGFAVVEAANGSAALASLRTVPPEIAVVDVTMPGISGTELIRRIRSEGLTLPVCVLSARDEVDDRVAGLAAGADDYVVKPFSITELAARLHALVRLHRTRAGRPLVVGKLVVNPATRTATFAGRDLELTSREFDLLETLARHPSQVLSRSQLLEQVWGYTWDVDSNAVDVFVGYLRRKLEADGAPRTLHTVRGTGFVLRPPRDP